MNAKKFLLDVAVTVPVTFVVAAAVTYLYNLMAYGSGAVNWETAFDLAITLGIVLPLTRARTGGSTSQ
jgi:hypothetical protein